MANLFSAVEINHPAPSARRVLYANAPGVFGSRWHSAAKAPASRGLQERCPCGDTALRC